MSQFQPPQYTNLQSYQPPQPPVLPPKKPRYRKRWLLIVGIVLLLAIAGAIGNVLRPSQPTSTTPQATVTPATQAHSTQTVASGVTPLVEHLTFRGDISGLLTMGEEPHPITHDNPIPAYVQQNGAFFAPAPTWTQCSDFEVSGIGKDYVAVIIGKVGTMHYAVTIEINEDNPAYTTPGTELHPGNINSGGSIEVYEMSGKNRRWQQVYGPAQQEPVIVLNTDRISGTVDAWLATTDQSQKFATGSLYLQGSWRCG